MKKCLFLWQAAGFIFTGALGTILHFLYDWSNESLFTALFAAVDESIFQHMKLLFFPMLIFSFIQARFIKCSLQSFFGTKLVGITIGILMIPILYYTYTGALGVSADWFNIVIFFICAAFVYWLEYKLFSKGIKFKISDFVAKTVLFLMALIFIFLTFNPPHIPLFADPLTKLYGI